MPACSVVAQLMCEVCAWKMPQGANRWLYGFQIWMDHRGYWDEYYGKVTACQHIELWWNWHAKFADTEVAPVTGFGVKNWYYDANTTYDDVTNNMIILACQHMPLCRNWCAKFVDNSIIPQQRIVHCTGSKFGWTIESIKVSMIANFQHASM
jgi:hypothetical protein